MPSRARARTSSRPSVLVVLVVAVAAVLAAGLVHPSPVAARPVPAAPGLEPIVFVHGLHDSSAAFTTMLQRFRDAGVPEDRLWAWNYDSRRSNVDSAADFAGFLYAVQVETGAPQVDVVTHSMGALPTRWCIRFGPCRRVVDDWVSLAGPNHGSNITFTCLLFPGEEGCPEMAVGSSLLDQLNDGDETPGQVDWTTIRSTTDQIISPSVSTELAGAANIVFQGLAHNDLLSEPAVFAKVAAAVFDGVAPGAARTEVAAAVTERADPAAPDAAPPVTAEAATGTIVVGLDTVPDAARNIPFSLCRGAGSDCRTLTLDDDADPTLRRRARATGLPAGNWKLVQQTPAGWALTAIDCDSEDRVQLDRSRVVIALSAGERPTCTFTVERSPTTSTTTSSSTSTTTTTTSSTTTSTSTSTTSTSTTTTSTTTTAPPPPPGNDRLADALTLPLATGTSTGTNRRATTEAGEPEHAETSPARTVWYRWTAGVAATVAVDTCASTFDTVLAVYQGPVGAAPADLTEVAADEDSCGQQSRVRFSSTVGTTYHLVVGGYGGAQGDLVLRRSLVTSPSSDAFAAATPLAPGGGTLEVTNATASAESREPAHAANPAARSVWFAWTAPADGPVTFATCGSDFDTVLAVYAGSSLTTLTPLAAADDTCELGARVGFVAAAGTTYRVVLDGFHGASGTATLSWG